MRGAAECRRSALCPLARSFHPNSLVLLIESILLLEIIFLDREGYCSMIVIFWLNNLSLIFTLATTLKIDYINFVQYT